MITRIIFQNTATERKNNMALIKTRGVILKVRDFKERDKLLYMFTLEQGKVTAIAKGVRSAKGRFQAAAQPMMLCDFVLFEGKNIHSLNEVSVVHGFPHIKTDFDRITYGSYFLELADIAMADKEINQSYFLDLVKSLYLLDQPGIQVEQLARAFEMKTLVRTGNLPDPALAEGMTESARHMVRIMLNKPIEEALQLLVSQADLKSIAELTDGILKECFQRRPKSLAILNGTY